MKITFESSNIADLKAQIQEYAISHLGLKVQDTVKQYVERAKEKDTNKRPAGRQIGWRKNPHPVTGEHVPAKENVVSGPSSTVETPVAGDPLKKQACKDMVAAVMGRFQDSLGSSGAFDKAKSCLEEFGVDHLDKLNPMAYDEFINFCKKTIGAK